MVRAYLNYERAASFGLVASPSSPAQLLSLPSGEGFAESPLVLCCCGASVRLWHCALRRPLLDLEPPRTAASLEGSSRDLAIPASVARASPSLTRVAVGFADGSVRVWKEPLLERAREALRGGDSQPLKASQTALVFHGHRGAVSVLRWATSDDRSSGSAEDWLFSGGVDGDVLHWDVEGGRGLSRFSAHSQPVTSLLVLEARCREAVFREAFASAEKESANSRQAKSRRKRLRLSSADRAFAAEDGSLADARLLLVSGSKDGLVKFWRPDLQLCVHSVLEAADAGEVWALATTPCQTRLFVGGGDAKVRVFALHFPPSTEHRAQFGSLHFQGEVAKAGVDSLLPSLTSYIGSVQAARPHLKQRIKQLLFVNTETPQAPPEETSDDGGPKTKKPSMPRVPPVLTGGILLAGSGNSRIVDCFRCCSAFQEKRMEEKRERRKKIRERKRKEKLKAEGGEDSEEEEVDGAAVSSSAQEQKPSSQAAGVYFVSSIHAPAAVKNFDASLRFAKSKASGGVRTPQLRVCLNLSSNALELWKADVSGLFKQTKADVIDFERVTELSVGGHAGQIRALSVSHDDGALLSVADEGAKLWTSSTQRCVKTLSVAEPQCGFFVAGNEHVVLGCRDGSICLFDSAVGDLLLRVEAHSKAVNSLAEHPKHTGFASISSDKTVKVFAFYLTEGEGCSPQTKQIAFRCVGAFDLPDEGLALAFDPRARVLACALLDFSVLVLHADSGKVMLTLYGHHLPVTCLSVASAGDFIATGSADKSVKVWGLDFGDLKTSFRAHEEAVAAVRFLPQTHYFLSAGLDGLVKMFDADRRCLVKEFVCGTGRAAGGRGGSGGALLALTLSADGDFFCCADSSRVLHLWRRTDEQVFAEEERERRLFAPEEGPGETERLDGLDAAAAVAASSVSAVLARPSRQTDTTIATAEKLMEALDAAEGQREEDALFAEALASWREKWEKNAAKKAKKNKALSEGLLLDSETPPLPPPLKPQLLGSSASEHLVKCTSAIKSAEMLDVVLALPFAYAFKLLGFLTAQLEAEALQAGVLTSHARDGLGFLAEETASAISGPVETAARLALCIVQLHFRLFVASPEHRAVVLRLQKVLRPLLLWQRDAIRFNGAALSFLRRRLAGEGVTRDSLMESAVSVNLQGHKTKKTLPSGGHRAL